MSPEVLEPVKLPEANSVISTASAALGTMAAPHAQSKQPGVPEWYAAPDLFDEDGETTATSVPRRDLAPKQTIASTPLATPQPTGNGKAAPTLTMLSAYGESETTAPPEWQARNALLVGLLLLVFFGVLGFGGWYWWAHRASAAQSPASAAQSAAPATTDPPDSLSATRAPKTLERPIANDAAADEEWKHLREKRIGAKPSEASYVIKSLEEAEEKYPRDYRFPYERAKLSIKGITSHHDAFGALALAAEKAIDNGKAEEMLDSLIADKEGDLWKPAHGHHEWDELIEALSNKDKKSLGALRH